MWLGQKRAFMWQVTPMPNWLTHRIWKIGLLYSSLEVWALATQFSMVHLQNVITTIIVIEVFTMSSARSWSQSWSWRTLGVRMPRWTSAGSTWGSTRWPLAAGDLECLLGHHDIFMARVIVMVQILGSSDCGYRRTAKEKSPQISIMKQITSLITQNCLTILTHSNRG